MADFEDGPPPLEDMSSVLERMRLKKTSPAFDRSGFISGGEPKGKESKHVRRDKASLLDDTFSHPAEKFLEETRETATARDSSTAINTARKPEKSEDDKDDFLKPLKRGFLTSSSTKIKEIPFIKASASSKASKKEIPDFMHVSSPLDKYREELTSMLKPTQEIVKEVLDNDDIKSGLDDPEIMAAVQDIANDYSAVHKYRNNPRVTKFYGQLGKLMGDKLEKKQGKSQV